MLRTRFMSPAVGSVFVALMLALLPSPASAAPDDLPALSGPSDPGADGPYRERGAGLPTRSGSAVQPGATAALEEDNAEAGSIPSIPSNQCVEALGTKTCFEKYGDKIWVKDAQSDGVRAIAYWQNWLWDGNNWRLYREGTCTSRLGFAVWGVCNKNFYEDSTYPNAYGSAGSAIWLFACAPAPDGIRCYDTGPFMLNDR